jgi:hypothetical protein
MKRLIRKIINSDTTESSKRFFSIWSMCLVTITVITSLIMTIEYVTILGMLLTFVCSLVGITSIETYKSKKIKQD